MGFSFDAVAEAKKVFEIEIDAINKTREVLDDSFIEILNIIVNCEGKVILTGMGKPGHIATKIAASLASLGTPAFFMHPAEGQHGDLGMVEEKDVVILISYSGESEEITKLLPVLKEINCTTIAITGNVNSTLSKGCNYRFVFPKFEEACYMHLAPTSSTTALLVLGDALAVVASKAKDYTRDDFGLHHPAGALGKKLLLKVENLMYSGDANAIVQEGSTLRNAIIEMSGKGLNMVTVINGDNELKGIITDGDLRRMLNKGIDVYNVLVDDVMTRNPKAINQQEMAVNALQKMNDLRITCLPVLDGNNKVVGSILMQDIIKTGIVR